MSEIVISVDESTLRLLQEQASAHGRTPEAEAKAILGDALAPSGQGAWARVNAIRQGLAASGRSFSDSTELLREDRDR